MPSPPILLGTGLLLKEASSVPLRRSMEGQQKARLGYAFSDPGILVHG